MTQLTLKWEHQTPKQRVSTIEQKQIPIKDRVQALTPKEPEGEVEKLIRRHILEPKIGKFIKNKIQLFEKKKLQEQIYSIIWAEMPEKTSRYKESHIMLGDVSLYFGHNMFHGKSASLIIFKLWEQKYLPLEKQSPECIIMIAILLNLIKIN